MGYIKKLKNNELVGGTDKTTIYPVTSAEAVFEEVSDNEFKSQKYLNNNITNERIVDNTIENRKLKDDTIDMGKLNTQLKTIIQNAYDASWKVKKEPFSLETKYDANDVVYDPDTNSSYVSLTADNQGNPVNPEDEGYVEGKWRIIINGISAVESTEVINAKVTELEEQVDGKIDDAQDQVDQMIADAAASLADAESDARGAAAEASAVVAEKVADAQIGYFECNTAEGTPVKATTTATIGTGTDASTYKVPAKGSIVKIKMQYATTSATNATLQFGNLTSTEHPLYYNGEPANDSNSWDAGEVLSVYYDGTYYQASNAMGGGSAVGKKQLKGSSGYINLNIEIGQTVTTTVSSSQNVVYKEIKVKEGDVFLLTIKKSGPSGRAWGFIDSDRILLDVAEANITLDNEVIVVPEGVDKVILHAAKSSEESEIIYEWYYAKAGSIGAHEMLTEAYLYGDLKTLAVGQTYEENEAVQTTDKQLLRITKEISAINIKDAVSAGDVKVSGANTYEAQKAVVAYTGDDTSYNDGDYAIGSFSEYSITVVAGSAEGNISINGTTIAITEGETAAEIAAAIVSEVTIEGWTLSNSGDVVTVKCDTIGNNITSIVFEDTDGTGVTVSGNTTPSVAGNAVVRVFDGSVWANAVLADYIADTSVWESKSASWLENNVAKQNSVVQDIETSTIWNGNEEFDISATTVNTNNKKYITPSKTSTYIQWAVKDTDTVGRQGHFTMPSLVIGKQYCIQFDYVNTINVDVIQQFGVYGSSNNNGVVVTVYKIIGTIPAQTSGKQKYIFTYTGKEAYLTSYIKQNVKNQYLRLSNISIKEYLTTLETIPQVIENTEILNRNILKKGTLRDIKDSISAENAANTAFNGQQWISAPSRLSLFLKVNFVPGIGKVHIAWTNTSVNCAVQMYNKCGDSTAKNPYNGLTGYCIYNSTYLSAGDYTFNIAEDIVAISVQATVASFNSLMNTLTALEVIVADSDRPFNAHYLSALLNSVPTPPLYSAVYPYKGERPKLTQANNTFYIEPYFTLNNSTNGVQGAAIYGDYLFHFSSAGFVEIYNFRNKQYLTKVSVPSHSSNLDHYDTASFGNQRVAREDEFPVIYTSGTQINSTVNIPYIKCFRIVHDVENSTWSLTLIQKINLPLITDIGTFPDAVIDNTDGSMWVMGWLHSEPYTTPTNKCLFTKFRVPSLDAGNVTIGYDERITQITVANMYGVQQGLSFYNGQIYVPYGVSTNGYQGVDIVDLQQQRVVTSINLINTPIYEPEAAIIYEGSLYIINQKNQPVYKITFY